MQNQISVKAELEIFFIEFPALAEISIPEQKQHFKLTAPVGAIPIDEAL